MPKVGFWMKHLVAWFALLVCVHTSQASPVATFTFDDQDSNGVFSEDGQFFGRFGWTASPTTPPDAPLSDGIPEWTEGDTATAPDYALFFEPDDILTIPDPEMELAWSPDSSFSLEWKWTGPLPWSNLAQTTDLVSIPLLQYGESLQLSVQSVPGNQNAYSIGWFGEPMDVVIGATSPWQHVVLSYDASTTSVSLLANGELLTTTPVEPWDAPAEGALVLQWLKTPSFTPCCGIALDDLRLYDRAVTVGEIDWYTTPAPEPDPEPFVFNPERVQIAYRNGDEIIPVVDETPEDFEPLLRTRFALQVFAFQDQRGAIFPRLNITFTYADGTTYKSSTLVETTTSILETYIIHELYESSHTPGLALNRFSLNTNFGLDQRIPLPQEIMSKEIRSMLIEIEPARPGVDDVMIEGMQFFERFKEAYSSPLTILEECVPVPDNFHVGFQSALSDIELCGRSVGDITLDDPGIQQVIVDVFFHNQPQLSFEPIMIWFESWADYEEPSDFFDPSLPWLSGFGDDQLPWVRAIYDVDTRSTLFRINGADFSIQPWPDGKTIADLESIDTYISDGTSIPDGAASLIVGADITVIRDESIAPPDDPAALPFVVSHTDADGGLIELRPTDAFRDHQLEATLEAHIHFPEWTQPTQANLLVEYVNAEEERTWLVAPVEIPQAWNHAAVRHTPEDKSLQVFFNGEERTFDLSGPLSDWSNFFFPQWDLPRVNVYIEASERAYIDSLHVHPEVVPETTLSALSRLLQVEQNRITHVEAWSLY